LCIVYFCSHFSLIELIFQPHHSLFLFTTQGKQLGMDCLPNSLTLLCAWAASEHRKSKYTAHTPYFFFWAQMDILPNSLTLLCARAATEHWKSKYIAHSHHAPFFAYKWIFFLYANSFPTNELKYYLVTKIILPNDESSNSRKRKTRVLSRWAPPKPPSPPNARI
jgi:hypothetical protein